VGEVLTALELIRRVRELRPDAPVYVSTTTLAGREAAEQRLGGLARGIFFAPLDYRGIVRRVLTKLRPAAVVVLETEIWPNLYREAKRAGAALLVVNGRISDRALPRYRFARAFFRHVLRWPDAVLAQSEEDARRFVIAGAPEQRVQVAGNLKYDLKPPAAGVAPDIAAWLDRVNPEHVWIAASTMPPKEPRDPDEDDAVIGAFAELARSRPWLLMILAPRQPERFDAAAEKLARAGVAFVRRSALAEVALPGVLLLDSIGELAALFEKASAVFMGGTLASRGGHNILEPAYFGKPVIAGPHMENFSEIAQEFTGGGALLRIERPQELAGAVSSVLQAPGETGERARALVSARRGAVARIAAQVLHHADLALPDPPHALLPRLILKPLTWIWSIAHRMNLKRGIAQKRSLSTRVVSVGGLSIGGAGKSPIVEHLAERLRAAGADPAILTRGYRRRSAEPVVIVPRGEKAPVRLTGDEAQMFVREAQAHVGIGADRFAVGRRMENELHPGVFLLDDGFQHVRVQRDEDIVLIDALNPLGGGIFPLGRLREGPASLARATAVIVTRTQPGQGIGGIENMVRRYNPRAPVFRSSVVPRLWIDYAIGKAAELPGNKVAAFCGLGEPRSFWRTLETLGLEVAFRWAFGDHHAYSPAELERIAAQASSAGAGALVTTEKDTMNLCEGAVELLQPHRLLWLKIGIEIENEQELISRLI
jgi:3-deoxy-D-manno-octulosonic-acid transferase